jgi:hypothetical protein
MYIRKVESVGKRKSFKTESALMPGMGIFPVTVALPRKPLQCFRGDFVIKFEIIG